MPVRIYDIAKKLGLESKMVLSKAKDLGIAAAKVPSSSLDKITAEYLEQQLAPLAPPPPPPAVEHVPVLIVSAPPEPPPDEPVAPAEVPPMPEPAAAPTIPADSQPAEPPAAPVELPKVEPSVANTTAPATPPPPPSPPPQPAAPKLPGIGEKIGWIDLGPRSRPTGRTAEARGGRDGGRDSGARASGPQSRGVQMQRGAPAPAAAKPAAPAVPKVSVSADAPLIMMKPPIIVRELAEKMGKKPFQVIADLMGMGAFVTVNQTIDTELAIRVSAKNNFRFETEKRQKDSHIINVPKDQELVLDTEDKLEELKPRPPVITIMGHVDHGKTSLLDVIRKANVAAGEAGGITQHIGAYTIQYPHPTRKSELMQLTFLDTPGHAAFSAMRARGANVTDIVVLVVAANDGVMPQTLEALAHAQAAKVPIIVAVNKCDHPNANPMKVRQQLQEKGLVPDDWGGDTLYVDCSALTKQGVDKLIDAILLQAELMELKANPNRRAKGNVIESGVEPGGPVATVLVRKGSLHIGDVIICGVFHGKVRAMMDEEGERLKEATPSVAVRVLGLNGVPEAGSEFSAVENERAARAEAEVRSTDRKKAELEGVRPKRQTLEDMFGQISDLTAKVLKVIVKADTQGSVEAICDALRKFDSDKVSLDIIHYAVGAISEYDVLLAASANAVILGFHTRVDSSAAEAAKREGVQIKLYAIIYELIDQVKESMAGLLDPLLKEVTVGQAEVRKIFELSKGGRVAGCYVSNGKLVRGKMRVRRRGHVVYEGISLTLKRFQDEVNEVRSGMECGVRLDGFDEIEEGDLIECYTTEKVAQKL